MLVEDGTRSPTAAEVHALAVELTRVASAPRFSVPRWTPAPGIIESLMTPDSTGDMLADVILRSGDLDRV
jgi:hypothetical protein